MEQTHPSVEPPTRGQVNRAAKAIRAFYANPSSDETTEAYLRAIDTIAAYRAQFAAPLVKVNVGLRGFCATQRITDAVVTQRLKRAETIREKLAEREKNMSLASMHDIGGCRVVLPDDNLDDLRRLERHINRVWEVTRSYDYVDQPRVSGYRAVHLVVMRDGYRIEIQLRTARMHLWAQTVESFSGHYSVNYKQDGDTDVQNLMASLSRIDQAQEAGLQPRIDDLEKVRTLAQRVRDSLRSERES